MRKLRHPEIKYIIQGHTVHAGARIQMQVVWFQTSTVDCLNETAMIQITEGCGSRECTRSTARGRGAQGSKDEPARDVALSVLSYENVSSLS